MIDTKTVKVTQEVLDVLRSRAVAEGNLLRLSGTLDRKLYVSVDKAIQHMGGKWDRHKKAHVFKGSAEAALADVLGTGQVQSQKAAEKDAALFETPDDLAAQVVQAAKIQRGHKVLEPSAGRGALVAAILHAQPSCKVVAIDILEQNCQALTERFGKKCEVRKGDFLAVADGVFDRIVMNPPFTRGSDIEHVMNALTLLAPKGLLVAIMSTSFEHRQTKAAQGFRELLAARKALVTPNPAGSFHDAGTDVRTVTVTIPGAESPSVALTPGHWVD